jgi:hypothetical protein
MSVRYQYPGGVLPEEIPLIERFESDVLPFVTRHGSEIGERAMQGDTDCEEVIRRHRLFVEGVPDLRPFNYRLLTQALKRWEHRRQQ